MEMATVNGTSVHRVNRFATLKGKAGKASKKTGNPATNTRKWCNLSLAELRYILTIGMGCMIPLLCSMLSHVAGTMINTILGKAIMLICCTLLGLSLSHLASAVADITRSGIWQSWAMAIAIDCSLVSCKLADALGYGSLLVWVIIVSVTIASMVLNVWAFLHSDKDN